MSRDYKTTTQARSAGPERAPDDDRRVHRRAAGPVPGARRWRLYLNKAPKPIRQPRTPKRPRAKLRPRRRRSSSPRSRTSPTTAPAAAAAQTGKPAGAQDAFGLLQDPAGQGRGRTGQGCEPRPPARARPSRVVYYLQAGAFQSAVRCGQLKARLALAGLEAQIQTATLPDNSVWHRVRSAVQQCVRTWTKRARR